MDYLLGNLPYFTQNPVECKRVVFPKKCKLFFSNPGDNWVIANDKVGNKVKLDVEHKVEKKSTLIQSFPQLNFVYTQFLFQEAQGSWPIYSQLELMC